MGGAIGDPSITWLTNLNDKMDPAIVRKWFEEMETSMIAAGYDLTTSLFGPGDNAGMNHCFISQMKAKKYDGVLIGFVVRGDPELMVFFEEIVNLVREHAPDVKLLFSSGLQSAVDAAKQQLPIA